MSYPENHTEDHCDKCGEKVGKANLTPAPFLYLDRNDHTHADAVPGNPRYKDYKQYRVCKDCLRK